MLGRREVMRTKMMIALQTCAHYLPKPAHLAGHLYSHVWDHVTNWSSSLLQRIVPWDIVSVD